MDQSVRSKEACSSQLMGAVRTISKWLVLGSAAGVFVWSLLTFATRADASSHNEVTGWTTIFGPFPVDNGGDIPAYVNAIAVANSSGSLVVIEGTCASACTIRLAAKIRCVKPDAILWFHSAVEGASISATGNAVLLDTYPPRVREEVLRRHMLDDVTLNPEHTLTGRELIKLGERACI